MDTSQYLEIFLDESKEHIQSLGDQLMIMEQEPENEDAINEIFRAAHSLKGMAGTMGYKRMQRLTHDMEDVFSEVRNGKMKVESTLIDVLFQALDALEEYLQNIQETTEEGTNDNDSIISELNRFLKNEEGGSKSAAPAAKEKVSAAAPDKEEKWQEIALGEHERHVMSEAVSQGNHVYGMTVYVHETCILKAARAFLVFKALEDFGEIVVSKPVTQDIEDEKFDLDFSVYVVTKAELDDIIDSVSGVSEIECVLGKEIDVEDMKAEHEEAVEEKSTETVPAETAPMPSGAAPASAGGAAPAAAASSANSAAAQKKAAGKPVVNRTVRVDIEKLDVLMNLVSELIIAKNSLVSVSANSEISNSAFNEQIEYLESVTTNLHESVMKVRMVPIESVVQKFPRMIRDLNKKLNKKMELYMSGEETELDRTVVDEIGDPLMHLLRNSADHGLESNEVRVQRGKPEVGSIYLNAYQDGNNVVIEVADDGNGIDVQAIKEKAINRGTITPDQAENMSSKEIIDLLFLPSFSTAKEVTEVSGRGVGLDVVKSKIEALGGDVSVKTELGAGSTFSIRLPLTLAIIQALMVEIGKEKYAISLGSIQTIEDIPPSDVKLVQNKEVIQLRGSVIPLVRLNQVLDIESVKNPEENMVVVVVKKGDNLAGLVVDELMGQQEIVIKSLGKYINCSKIISGATILGDGEVALILDANALI